MTDTERLIDELRRIGEVPLAEQLDKAQYGSTGSEILGDIGAALLGHAEARAKLSPEGRGAWDRLKAQVDRAFPGWSFRSRLARFFSWSRR